ncbi:MAG: hypothetical protein MI920_18335 [Kiloniellales bacterium]|nr:hypothetical protein [Kiloniellales bacterium]
MINQATILAEALGEHISGLYRHYFGDNNPEFATCLDAGVRLTMERIACSDALYHNMQHTMMVTLVGQDILRGKIQSEPVMAEDWLHYTLGLLFHDIGYVRGICRGDTDDCFVIDEQGRCVTPPRGASDAFLSPYHIERGKLFVRERFAETTLFDAERIACAIELTRFPVPDDSDHAETDTEAGLVRAADLIGQLADPFYLRNLNALYHEFLETGTAAELGYASPADLLEAYPRFFWSAVEPYVRDAIRFLERTQEGRQWVANLYSHVFAIEHRRPHLGPYNGLAGDEDEMPKLARAGRGPAE